MVEDVTIATLTAVSVTASFPFFLYGAWIMLDAETVTWDVLIHHLKFIAVGLTLTTTPMVGWMLPRLFEQFGGLSALHAILGLQAYALLVVGLTGIVRIFQAKRAADLYTNPDQDVDLDDLHENMSAWRARLRIGVFGYTLFWLAAWATGLYRYVIRYLIG